MAVRKKATAPVAKKPVKAPAWRAKRVKAEYLAEAVDEARDALGGAATKLGDTAGMAQAMQEIDRVYGPKHIVHVTLNSRSDMKDENISFELRIG